MLLKLPLPRHLPISNAKTNTLRYLLCNFLSTACEATQASEASTPPRLSQFFMNIRPPVANSIKDRKLDGPNNLVNLLSENTDPEVEKFCKILKNRYPSPENVVEALEGCDLELSRAKIEQLLKRFSNDWIPAFGLFKWAKTQTGYVHSPELYNFMVDVLGKSRKFKIMWELVEEMCQLEGYVSLVTMTRIIRRLARAGLYKEAIETFKGMERLGISKDISALNILMNSLVNFNRVKDAHEVFLEFKETIPLNDQSFNILIHGWCKARKFDDARKTMEEMEKHGFNPNVVSYTSFIEMYGRDRDFTKIDAILDEMQTKGCYPTAVTYTIIIHAFGKARKKGEVLEVYEKMKKNGCVPSPSTYSSLVYSLGRIGKFKDACGVFEDMTKQGVTPDLLTYNTMICCACSHRQEEAALKLLKKMEETSCKPNLQTYAPLLKMCCKRKRMKLLYFLLNHMFNNDVSIEAGTYSLLIHGLRNSGKLKQACFFFKEMVSKGFFPNNDVYESLRDELESKSMLEAKENIENLMLKARQERI
ncbi:hypothetical protein UlMin_037770 [Ulmus minor]